MLGKMLIQGLLAAAIVGSAAAVYAQAADNGSPAPAAAPDQRQEVAAETGNGYLRPTEADIRGRGDKRRHDGGPERHGERDDRSHDDDDD